MIANPKQIASVFSFTRIPFRNESVNLIDNESNSSKVSLFWPYSDSDTIDFLEDGLSLIYRDLEEEIQSQK